jgi:hypothetical protein
LEEVQSYLAVTEGKVHETMLELEETQESLATTSVQLSAAEQTIERQNQEIFDLGKALEQGKRGAKMVLGLLTLGALCTDDR